MNEYAMVHLKHGSRCHAMILPDCKTACGLDCEHRDFYWVTEILCYPICLNCHRILCRLVREEEE